jgi:hypothetical protein
MKKILFILVTFLTFNVASAQGNFEIGAAVGIPTADASDLSDFMIAIDSYYMFRQENAFINLGPTVGFRNFFVKDIDFQEFEFDAKDASFLTIGGAGRITLFGKFRGGADVGYAVGLTDYLDGGFYFRPMVGIDILNTLELNAAYETIWDNATWGSFQIGAKLQF